MMFPRSILLSVLALVCLFHGGATVEEAPATVVVVQPIPAVAGSIITSKAWRIRNAVASSSNAWSIRGLKFCLDDLCHNAASGEPFDSGNSRDWAPPSSLFDDATDPEFSNFWKSFDGDKAGESYVGLVLDDPTWVITAIAIRPDNVVYGIDTVYVEYWNGDTDSEVDGDAAESWELYAVLDNVPKHYGDVDGYWIADFASSSESMSASSTLPLSSSSSRPSAVTAVSSSILLLASSLCWWLL